MHNVETTSEGARVLAICNACRYCEQYCPAFQALEERRTFATADLNYLANLCHGCGECLYACQYAPPHAFAINVPQTFARLRVQSYEQYAWPAALGGLFRRQGVTAALALAAILSAAMLGAAWLMNGPALRAPGAGADFYAVVPHAVMAALFGGVGLLVVAALAVGLVRCRRDLRAARASVHAAMPASSVGGALGDVLTLRHLHAAGQDCATGLEQRTPWRRRWHHATFYGFALCFAATCVATLYHYTGSPAPYAYTSLPVLLGTAGGVGLVVGPLGLLLQQRDPRLSDATEHGLDRAFLVLLLLTALTGLLLLALREGPFMGYLLVVHLGVVLALFATLPYGKFVHGLYRAAALSEFRRKPS
jgi:citrate/tricarballylate utilization protein